MISLLDSETFKKEYSQYQTKIEKISDISVKNQATTLLKTLIAEITKLDSQHQDMFAGNQVPMGLGDVRSNITGIRKKLEKICKDGTR